MKRGGIWFVNPKTETYKEVGRFTRFTWDVYHDVKSRMSPSTVQEVAEHLGSTKSKARRHLKKLWRLRYLAHRRIRFWNGMHYADRDYFW